MIKIDYMSLHKYGKGIGIGLPRIYIEDNELTSGDHIDIFRSNVDGKDVLILVPKKNNGNGNLPLSDNNPVSLQV